MVAGGDAKAPDQAARLQAGRQHDQAGLGQPLLERLDHLLGALGRQHAVARADQQRIAEQSAEPGERTAHRRLADADPLRGLGHAARLQKHREMGQKVEVDLVHGQSSGRTREAGFEGLAIVESLQDSPMTVPSPRDSSSRLLASRVSQVKHLRLEARSASRKSGNRFCDQEALQKY